MRRWKRIRRTVIWLAPGGVLWLSCAGAGQFLGPVVQPVLSQVLSEVASALTNSLLGPQQTP